MEFSKLECCSGLPLPSPGDLLDPGLEPMSPALAGRLFTTEPPRNPVDLSVRINCLDDDVTYRVTYRVSTRHYFCKKTYILEDNPL